MSDENVELAIGDGFNLPIKSDVKFDLIHIERGEKLG
jgi:hypothetical protein